jgi:hypothetical protein
MVIMTHLAQYKQLALSAWNWCSFYPERIGSQILADYEAELKADLDELAENAGNYAEKYKIHFSAWLQAQSRCMSSFITGPSNFPISKSQKARNSEQNKYNEFRKWRECYIKAVKRVKTPSPEQDLQDAMLECDQTISLQELMKMANKAIKKEKDKEKRKVLLSEIGFTGKQIEEILDENQFLGMGFKGFQLTNNNAKIKRLKDKILIMQNRIAVKETFEPIRFDGGSIEIENDRVIVKHDERPDQMVIDSLKRHGFRWSRNFNCWCRKHTKQAILDAKKIVGV